MKRTLQFIAASILLTSQSFASVNTVTNNGISGAGTLRDLITNATAGDTIIFDASLVNDTIEVTTTSITINVPITIIGLGNNKPVLYGNGGRRFFIINSSAAPTRLEGLTIYDAHYNGTAISDGGGGILALNSQLILDNCLFIDCHSGAQGGAIFMKNGGKLTATNCVFSKNSASSNGGTVNAQNGSILDFDNCNFTNNTSNGDGGTIFMQGDSLYFSSCSIDTSSARKNGGAISMEGGGYSIIQSSSIKNSIATGASNPFGGAIYYNNGVGEINKSLIYNCTANFGGAIFLRGITSAMLNINSSTISNSSSVNGNSGCIFNEGGDINFTHVTIAESSPVSILNQQGTLTFSFSLINDIITQEFNGNVASAGYNLFSDPVNDGPTGTTNLDPTDSVLNNTLPLRPLADNGGATNTHGHACGSAAIDYIPSSVSITPSTDQRGANRLSGVGYDVGAFELTQINVSMELGADIIECDTLGATYDLIATTTADSINFKSISGNSLAINTTTYSPSFPMLDTVVAIGHGGEFNCSIERDTAVVELKIVELPTVTFDSISNLLTSSIPTGNLWYRDGFIIPGAINQTYTAVQSGTHTVRNTNANGCIGESEGADVAFVSVSENNADFLIELGPNPVNTNLSLNLSLKKSDKVVVEIYNVLGETIRKTIPEIISQKTYIFDFSELDSGIYFISTKTPDTHITKKIIKE